MQKNTEQTIIFVMASSDNMPVAGKTVTAEISKAGAAFVATTNDVEEISDGFYAVTLTASELNYDVVTLKFTATSCGQQNIVIYLESAFATAAALATHDTEVKAAVAAIDPATSAELATHDTDIKALCAQLRVLIDDIEIRIK